MPACLRVQSFAHFWFILILVCGLVSTKAQVSQNIRGTLVVAVPVSEGLVVCADKRLYNTEARTFTDTNVKIRKVDNNSLFVATNTIGFYDRQTRTMGFDAFEIATNFVAKNRYADGKKFWDGLKKEINDNLRAYFAKRKFAEWPESDRANNNLLFNLVFYSVRDGQAFSQTLRVFYEKKQTPVIYIPDPVSENVRSPKLSGKGREVINFLARNPTAASDPAIQRFDETVFNAQNTTVSDAVGFSKKLFQLTSTGVPQANVSPTFDCALLNHATGFKFIS